MRMKSLPSQRDITSSVLSGASPVPVITGTEGHHVPYFTVLLCHVSLLLAYCFTLSSTSPLTKRFLHQNSCMHVLFLPPETPHQYTVPLLIFTIVTTYTGLTLRSIRAGFSKDRFSRRTPRVVRIISGPCDPGLG
jgi:hypothetical protein